MIDSQGPLAQIFKVCRDVFSEARVAKHEPMPSIRPARGLEMYPVLRNKLELIGAVDHLAPLDYLPVWASIVEFYN